MKAWIYARWSHPSQKKGDSFRRQREDCLRMCSVNGWEYSDDRLFHDDGKSGWTGANRQDGATLYDFEREVVQGLHKNAVLIVEKGDRITREGADEAYDFLKMLLRHDVTFATVEDNEIFKPGERVELTRLFVFLHRAELAEAESNKKSTRLRPAWAKKRRDAIEHGFAMTNACPGWLTIDPMTRRYVEHDKNADVVRQIFEWAAAGYGTHVIAKRLNESQIPAWGRKRLGNKADDPNYGIGDWNHGYIALLLDDRRVIGEHQHLTRGERTGARVKLAVGEIVRNYYPLIVPLAVFERVQAVRADRRGSRGRGGETMGNLLAGILNCAVCNRAVTICRVEKAGRHVSKKTGRVRNIKEDRAYLACDRGQVSGCSNKGTINLHKVTATLLDAMLHLALDAKHFERKSDIADLEGAAAAGRIHIADLKSRRQRFWEMVEMGVGDDTSTARLIGLRIEIAEAEAELARGEQALIGARGQVNPEEHLRRVQNVRTAICDDDQEVRLDARRRVHMALKGVIDDAWLNPDSSATFVLSGMMAAMQIGRRGEMIAKNDNVLRRTAEGLKNNRVEALAGRNRDRAEDLLRRFANEGVGFVASA